MYKRVAGVVTFLGDSLPVEAMTPGRCYIAHLEFEGQTLTMTVDGVTSSPVIDTDIAAGAIGVLTVDTDATFDNVSVYLPQN